MIDELSKAIDEGEIKIFSGQLQKECRQLIVNDDGSMGAQEGYHDDTVIAMAIAIQMRKRWIGQRISRVYKKSELGF